MTYENSDHIVAAINIKLNYEDNLETVFPC